MSRTPLARGLAFVLALLHLLVLPLAAVADARLDRDSVSPGHETVHVESRGSPRGQQVHPSDCALCQFVAAVAAPARPAPSVPTAVAVLAPPVAGQQIRSAAGGRTLALPRAPPAS